MTGRLLLLLLAPLLVAFSYREVPGGLFHSYHVLEVDPTENPIALEVAEPMATVLQMTRDSGAVAGVNGGFFRENGDPAGILRNGDEWHGFPTKFRGAIGWAQGGTEVLIDRLGLEKDHLTTEVTDPDDWEHMDVILGGVPLLVRNGVVIDDYSIEKALQSFLDNPHARTAVGIRADGTWVFVVVEMDLFHLFGGITMRELGQLMLDLGCRDALNLDGGGSSTMVVEDSVVNRGEHREVSDAIVILPSSDH